MTAALTPFADHADERELEPSEAKVLPLARNAKTPLIEGGFHAASADPAQLRKWADEHADANVGLDLGSVGLWVLDEDPKNGGDATLCALELVNGNLPPTRTVKTPSGGRHLYFTGPFPPQTAGKLGPGLDTRVPGKGYVVIPPSMIDGTAYEVIDARPPASLAADHWLQQLLQARDHAPATAAPGSELDSRANRRRATRWLKDRAPAIEGHGGNAHTYATVARVRGLGISEEIAPEILDDWNERCEPPWPHDELGTLISNVYRYAQNDAGCDGLSDAIPEEWKAAIAAAERGPLKLSAPSDRSSRFTRFKGRSILEYRDLAPLEYWGPGPLPKMPGGASVLLFAPSGAGKTTAMNEMIGGAILAGARVLVCAGEGAYGYGKQRVPELARSLGLTLEALAPNLQIVDQAVNLLDPEDVAALIEANRDYAPHIVVIDTLAASTPGADENSAATASLMTGGGAVGQIKAAFDAAVLVLHHTGKDATKGARGSSGFMANADAALELISDKEAGTARLRVRKMRDGPDDFCIFYRVTPGLAGVPVAQRVAEAEYKALTTSDLAVQRREVVRALRGLEDPISTLVLATLLVQRAEGQSDEDHERRVSNEKRNLNRLANDSHSPLQDFLARDHRGEPLKPRMWMPLPALDDGGGDA